MGQGRASDGPVRPATSRAGGPKPRGMHKDRVRQSAEETVR